MLEAGLVAKHFVFGLQVLHVLGVSIDVITQEDKKIRLMLDDPIEDGQVMIFMAAGAKGDLGNQGCFWRSTRQKEGEKNDADE
jgi:hypothetical protein